MNNEPVAIRYDFDGYGYQYMDSGSGSDWQTRVEGEFLYTHPAKEHDLGISHAIGFDDGFKAGMQRVVEMNVVRTLTDEEIYACFHQYFVLGEPKPTHYELEYEDLIDFARAILRKAQEK